MKLQKKVGNTINTYNVEECLDKAQNALENFFASSEHGKILKVGENGRITTVDFPTWNSIKPSGGIPASDLAFIPVTNKQTNNKLLINTSKDGEVTINGGLIVTDILSAPSVVVTDILSAPSVVATNSLTAPLVVANSLTVFKDNLSDSLTITGLSNLKDTLGLIYSEPFNITWEDNIVAADTDSYHRVFYSRYYPALKMCFIHAEFRPKTDAVFGTPPTTTSSGHGGQSRKIFTLTQKNGYSFQLRPEHEQPITTYCYLKSTNGKIRKGTGTGDTENENNIYGYLHTTTPPLTTTSTIFINGFWSVEGTN